MSENREEHCWRIGGPVYMRDDRPCPECGALDTHEPSSSLRRKLRAAEIERDCWATSADIVCKILGRDEMCSAGELPDLVGRAMTTAEREAKKLRFMIDNGLG